MEKVTTVLQTEVYKELGVAFVEHPNGEIWCAIDWPEGEMKFKLKFGKLLNHLQDEDCDKSCSH